MLASSLQSLEEENQALELQIKNEELRQKLQNLQNHRSQEVRDKNKSLKQKFQILQEQTYKINEVSNQISSYSNKDEKRTWLLVGIGLGFVNSKANGVVAIPDMTTTIVEQYRQANLKSSYNSLMLNIRLGAMTMWNRYFGLEYYYDFSYSYSDTLQSDETLYMESAWLKRNLKSSITALSSTLNTNAVMNAYNSDNFGIGFIVGFGLGLETNFLENKLRLESHFGRISYGYSKLTDTNFNIQANIGLRFVIRDYYGIDLRCSIPFFATPIKDIVTHNNIAFSIGFTYAKF